MKIKTEDAYFANIYIAGDINMAKHIRAEYCYDSGLCVTVTATEFIYTGGRESGIVVGLVNYPRFPSTPKDIQNSAEKLTNLLIEGLAQTSALVQTPENAVWFSRRTE